MHTHDSVTSDLPVDKSIQRWVTRILGILLMFLACLLVCHVPGMIHLLEHSSL